MDSTNFIMNEAINELVTVLCMASFTQIGIFSLEHFIVLPMPIVVPC